MTAQDQTPGQETVPEPAPRWYHWVLAFVTGIILVNGVPHYVTGMLGKQMPTPFSNPPFTGMSSATVNATWGMTNLAGGYALLRYTGSRIRSRPVAYPAVVFAGAFLFSAYFSTANAALASAQASPGL